MKGRRTLKGMVPSLAVRIAVSPIILIVFTLAVMLSLLLIMAGESERSERMLESIMDFITGKE